MPPPMPPLHPGLVTALRMELYFALATCERMGSLASLNEALARRLGVQPTDVSVDVQPQGSCARADDFGSLAVLSEAPIAASKVPPGSAGCLATITFAPLVSRASMPLTAFSSRLEAVLDKHQLDLPDGVQLRGGVRLVEMAVVKQQRATMTSVIRPQSPSPSPAILASIGLASVLVLLAIVRRRRREGSVWHGTLTTSACDDDGGEGFVSEYHAHGAGAPPSADDEDERRSVDGSEDGWASGVVARVISTLELQRS